jgi:hypothetical protein
LKKGVYLKEEKEYVGPFAGLKDAELFLTLMKLFGVSCEGIEIVTLDVDDRGDESAVTPQEKHRLAASRKRTGTPPGILKDSAGDADRQAGEREKPLDHDTTTNRKRQ